MGTPSPDLYALVAGVSLKLLLRLSGLIAHLDVNQVTTTAPSTSLDLTSYIGNDLLVLLSLG